MIFVWPQLCWEKICRRNSRQQSSLRFYSIKEVATKLHASISLEDTLCWDPHGRRRANNCFVEYGHDKCGSGQPLIKLDLVCHPFSLPSKHLQGVVLLPATLVEQAVVPCRKASHRLGSNLRTKQYASHLYICKHSNDWNGLLLTDCHKLSDASWRCKRSVCWPMC